MADFTQAELNIIGKSLEDYYIKATRGYRVGEDYQSLDAAAEILALRYKLVGIYGENLGDGLPMLIDGPVDEAPELAVGSFYRVVQEDHKLDGQRVKLERVEEIPHDRTVRTWVINGIMEVLEVPSTSLVACS